MTYAEIISLLEKAGIADADCEAGIILEKLCLVEPWKIPLLGDRDFDSPELARALEKRTRRVPLQYILGESEFYGLPFEVNGNCLCPRPDTELLVEKTIGLLKKNGSFLELCTGSGCISTAICHNRPDVCGVATDIFPATLALARSNAAKNRIDVDSRLTFLLADALDPKEFISGGLRKYVPEKKFDMVISNPPYIETEKIDDLSPEVRNEPRAALDGGADGLIFYRAIIGRYAPLLAENGVIALEIGYDQGKAVSEIAAKNGKSAEVYKDLGGNDRVIIIK